MTNHNQWLFRQQLSVVTLTKILLDPFVAVLVLIGCTFYFDEPFRGPYPILALIVFTLTFPGKWPEVTLRAFWNEVVMPWFFLSGLILLFGYSTGYLDFFPPNLVIAWMLITPVAMWLAHRVVRKILPRLLLLEGGRRLAIIVGAGNLGTELRGRFANDSSLGVDVAGFFDDRTLDRTDLADPKKLLGRLVDIPAYVNSNGIDLVYITLPMASQPRTLSVLDALRDTTASVYFVPDIFVSDLIQARVDHIHGMPVVALTESPTLGVSGIGKRISDVIIAGLILLLIWPVLLILAAGVKLSSPGPVIFKQRRYGLDGQEILVYKFRSMRVCDDGAVIQQAGRCDPRTTRFGAFIRRTSLELSAAFEKQKANVLGLKQQREEASLLARDLENSQRIYDSALQRYGQSRMEAQSTQTDIAVLNPAVAPTQASKPRVMFNVLLSVFFGTLLGVGLGFLIELLDRRVRSGQDIAMALDIPVLAEVSTKGRLLEKLRRLFRRNRPAMA